MFPVSYDRKQKIITARIDSHKKLPCIYLFDRDIGEHDDDMYERHAKNLRLKTENLHPVYHNRNLDDRYRITIKVQTTTFRKDVVEYIEKNEMLSYIPTVSMEYASSMHMMEAYE